MDVNSASRSPREEGELEDGEICDDEPEESVLVPQGGCTRPGNASSSRTRNTRQHPRNMLPLMGHQPPDFRLLYNMGAPHLHGPFPLGHRQQQCGPSGPDRPPPPPPPPGLPGLGIHGEPSPRSNFWERSHGALGRFRHRSVPNGGRGNWSRGGSSSRAPLPGRYGPGGEQSHSPGRYGPGESHGNKKDSPSRKQKPSGRNQPRKLVHSVAKSENGVDETFEDLLSKYKQIQLELECIRKEETMALEPKDSPARAEAPETPASILQTKPVSETTSIQSPAAAEEAADPGKAEIKSFQAFNIKPLRQKLLTPAELDALKKTEQQDEGEEEDDDGEKEGELSQTPKLDVKNREKDPVVPAAAATKGDEVKIKQEAAKNEEKPEIEGEETATKKICTRCSKEPEKGENGKAKKSCTCSESSPSSEDSSTSPDKVVTLGRSHSQPGVKGKVEEEELSELQLRLLALQSASKKWQQKEQQVMKESKDRITRASQEKSSSSSPSAASPSKQRVTTRSASSATAAASERTRTRSKLLERDWDRAKAGARPPERDRERANASERERPKPGFKPGFKPGLKPHVERGRTPAKPHMARKTMIPGSAAKQAFRKQQLRTWKLQQQREQNEMQRQEDEERRKREDEIRKIRDLSNQDEQYNRFMKLVGGKNRTRSKSRDREHRKSTGKQGLDASGNLYQYDNYDEVAMETDSETSSPVASPTHNPFAAEDPGSVSQMPLYPTDSPQFAMDFAQPFLYPMLSTVPPPPPPLPPPPDELEQPPKPPFADEEEEEEMLLRETCLMSMASKRVVEEMTSSSAPPSPSPQPAAGFQPPPRGNLSTVSLNTVPQSRSNKFTRGHHAPRAPLMLPRHKAVVVQLNDSDDSDSDMDACSSTQMVLGGLEFMIKEARRTVEAAKPKGTSGSEKENNPVRTPEALPEAKKTEYRLLKEEIASREKQKLLKEHSHSPRRVASPAASDSELDLAANATAELQLSEAEERLTKHRALLQKDEAILRHLLQQELKKRESLKATEAKVAKLKEQLLASEKIVTANKVLLKKLQEQVHRVEHRVSIKKSQSLKLEKELVQAQTAAGRGLKRRQDSNNFLPSKLQRVDGVHRGSERQFAELIAQKQRLQQLESEYALKIQKLKEAQALCHRVATPVEPPAEARSIASTPAYLPVQPPLPSGPFPLPQPSLHDLTQDKLTLGSEDITEDHEPEPAAASRGTRRHSLRQSSSFTKPNLEQLGSTPAKDNGAAKPAKASASTTGPAEMFTRLDMDALKHRYQQQPPLGEMLLRELHRVGEDVDNSPAGKVIAADVDAITSQAGTAELKPVPFGPYHSPLLVFRSYRFSPYYRTKEKLSLSSVTYSNAVEPKKSFCRFDLTGTCNDDDCRWQHMRNCTLTGNQLFQDILSYNLSLISCSDSSSNQDISVSTEKYIKKLFGANKDRMGIDQKAVLLVSKVNESKRHVPPYTTCKDVRRWRPKPSGQTNPDPAETSEDETIDLVSGRYDSGSRTSLSALDVCVTSEDNRYFASETDNISNLESSVLESPRDAQLWIKLAFKYLSQNETSASECLDAALNTLSRALEDNCNNPEIWTHYLSLFSRRGSREEIQEMCEMAVEHASDYQVWWSYLNLESSFEGKDYVCDRLLQYLLTVASSSVTDKLSFQLMEALLYRVDLNLFTGRMESALAILQNALKSANDRSIAEHLTASDRALVWLSFIHLTEFDRLPSSLYNPADSSPSRLVSTEPFQLPWRTPQDISTPPDILIALFQDAIQQCSDETLPPGERTPACMPLHTNLIFLNKLLQRFDVGIQLCESLLERFPESCTLRDALADLHIGKGDGDQAVSMWLHALVECPNNAEVFYHSCKFLMAQEKSSAIVPLFRGFVLSLCEDEQSQKQPVDVLRHMLGIPTEQILRGPIIRKEIQEQLGHQMSYLHLVHCRWQWLHGTVEETRDAFERALGSAMKLDVLHKLWMDYLLFSSSPRSGPAQSRLFSDLVQRCLGTVPSRLEVPFSPAQFQNCYRFHNKVVSHYLSCLPQSQHALVLERLRYSMPNNCELGLRLLHREWEDGNMEHLKFQARMLSSIAPKCVANWRIAIAVEREMKERSERLLFEAAEGGKTDKLRKLVDKCQEVGVSLSEPLNLVPGRTQDQ